MCLIVCVGVFFCFKQKTAYEMRISDWSSDVCSSDLLAGRRLVQARQRRRLVDLALAVPRKDDVEDLAGGNIAVANADIDVFGITQLEYLDSGIERLFRHRGIMLAEGLHQDRLAQLGILAELLLADEAVDAGLGAAGLDEVPPGRIGRRPLGGPEERKSGGWGK